LISLILLVTAAFTSALLPEEEELPSAARAAAVGMDCLLPEPLAAKAAAVTLVMGVPMLEVPVLVPVPVLLLLDAPLPPVAALNGSLAVITPTKSEAPTKHIYTYTYDAISRVFQHQGTVRHNSNKRQNSTTTSKGSVPW
jgi:hypothetical protein